MNTEKIDDDYIINNQNKIDWFEYVDEYQLSDNILRMFSNKIDWEQASVRQQLSPYIIREFANRLDWEAISQYQKLNDDIIREFQDRLNWEAISKYQKLSPEIIQEFSDRLNWYTVAIYQKLNEDIIRQFQDKLDWNYVSRQKISFDFVKEFQDKLNLKDVLVFNFSKDVLDLYLFSPILQSELNDIENEGVSQDLTYINKLIFTKRFLRIETIIPYELVDEIVEKYFNYIDWVFFFRHMHSNDLIIVNQIILNYGDKFDKQIWYMILGYYQISDDNLNKYKYLFDKKMWSIIANNSYLSPEFIKNNIQNIKRYRGILLKNYPTIDQTTKSIIAFNRNYEKKNIQRNECPDHLQPVDGECPDKYPFKFKTSGGEDCCYKIKDIRSITKFKFKPKLAFKNLDKTKYNDTLYEKLDLCPDLNKFVHELKIRQTPFLVDELYIRSIDVDEEDVCGKLQDELPSLGWIQHQLEYITSLNEKQQTYIRLYTHNGDVALNTYIRQGHIDEDLFRYILGQKRDVFGPLIQKYVHPDTPDKVLYFLDDFRFTLMKIIENAPVLQERVVVYRGITNIDYFNGVENKMYINKGFVSTSAYAHIAYRFSKGKYMQRIILLPGTHCLLMLLTQYKDEFEILLSDECVYKITKEFQLKKTLGKDVEMNESVIIKS
jgi:hypothetical protein